MDKLLKTVIVLLVITMFVNGLLMGTIGAKAGVMLSKMDIGFSTYYSFKTWTLSGGRADVFYSLPLKQTILLQPGISFAVERTRYYDSRIRGFSILKVSFIKIPVSLVLAIPLPNEPINKLEIFAGPYIAYRLGKEKNSSYYQNTFAAKEKLGLGLSAGIRLYLAIDFRSSMHSFIEIHGDLGLTRFTHHEPRNTYYKSANISFMVGFTF